MSEGLFNMALGMGFVFLFLGVLVGYMHLVAAGFGKEPAGSGKGGGVREQSQSADSEEEETRSVVALSDYETGSGLGPEVSAAIGMALFQILSQDASKPGMGAGRGRGDAWRESGRTKVMGQREMWFWRRK